MASTLLHLVDDEGQPVGPVERIAVEGAHCYAAREFPRIDNAVLAGMAEAVAVAMSRRLEEIRSVNQWALAAMVGKVHDWCRTHPLEVALETETWEQVTGGLPDPSFLHVENEILFSQIRTQLSERDRQILVLIEQDLGTAADIASALGLSYEAAKKALQRAKEKIGMLLGGNENRAALVSRNSYRTTRRNWT